MFSFLLGKFQVVELQDHVGSICLTLSKTVKQILKTFVNNSHLFKVTFCHEITQSKGTK